MRPLYRPPPLMPPQRYQTYHVARPIGWWVFASCAEVGCGAYLRGWTTIVDADKASVVRRCGRSYTETRDRALHVFRFGPGQRCFHSPPPDVVGKPIVTVLAGMHQPEIADRWHKRVQQREPIFTLTAGDWRGNPLGTNPVRFRNARAFVDDFGEHQQRVAELAKRG